MTEYEGRRSPWPTTKLRCPWYRGQGLLYSLCYLSNTHLLLHVFPKKGVRRRKSLRRNGREAADVLVDGVEGLLERHVDEFRGLHPSSVGRDEVAEGRAGAVFVANDGGAAAGCEETQAGMRRSRTT